MNDNLNDNGQFKMRSDDATDETAIPTDVEDLRIEKLNHRMTLISILIPVLIVVVLAIAYLDIKKRVMQTEDTGQLTAETLTKDLESRYDSLTMAQKMIEENLSRLKDQSDQSVAMVQINIKKLEDRLKSAGKKMVSQKDMKSTTAKLDQGVKNVAQSIEELKLQVDELNASLQPKFLELQNALTENKTQMDQLYQKLTVLDQNKIEKSAMDLAIKLEVLKIKRAYKAQLEELQDRVKSVERKVARPAIPKTPPKAAPKSAPAPASPSSAPSPGKLEERTIGR